MHILARMKTMYQNILMFNHQHLSNILVECKKKDVVAYIIINSYYTRYISNNANI